MKTAIKAAVLIALLKTTAAFCYLPISDTLLYQWITAGTTTDFLLIDVRDSSELDTTGIIATDSCIPYNLSWNQGILSAKSSLIPTSAVIVLYCRAGGRSAAAAAYLDGLHFSSVYCLTGGYSNWSAHGRAAKNRALIKDPRALPAPSMAMHSTSVQYLTANNFLPVNAQNHADIAGEYNCQGRRFCVTTAAADNYIWHVAIHHDRHATAMSRYLKQ